MVISERVRGKAKLCGCLVLQTGLLCVTALAVQELRGCLNWHMPLNLVQMVSLNGFLYDLAVYA